MSCGFKLLMLLSTPFPLRPSAAIRLARHPRLPFDALSAAVASRGRLLSVVPPSKRGFSIRAADVSKEGHSETVTLNPRFKDSYSWPEWSKLTDHLLAKSFSQRPVSFGDEDDSFSTDYTFSDEFLRAAEACLNFSREKSDILRLLTKKYIKAVVENGSPYLFKNGQNSVSRMRLFLDDDVNSVLEPEKAQTIDIMRYLLSYMYKPFSTSIENQSKSDEFVETSVRKLLLELFNVSGTVWRSKLGEPKTTEPSFQNDLSRPRGQSFEMKRGDWICQKCTFINFARNMSCLECGEARPKRLLTGAEWECPQCDFFNYGRNTSCLRCDCKRPGDSLPISDSAGGLEHGRNQTFLQDSRGHSSVRLESDITSDSISRSLDRILGRSPTSSGTLSTAGENITSTLGNLSSSQIGQNPAKQRRNPDVAPFVPLPPDMFRKTSESNDGMQQSSDQGVASSQSTSDLIDSLFKSSGNSIKGDENKDSSNASSRSFKTDAGHEYTSTVSDDDFPDIMPMRKGENRFVVSKKKDRSLTSPAYKRRLAMEQANNYNSIPFVPFPPDYFAKKDKAETLPENQGDQKSGTLDQGFACTSSPQSNQNNFTSPYGNSTGNSSQPTNSSWNSNGENLNKTQKNSTVEAEASYGSPYRSNQPDSNSGKYTGYKSNSYGQFTASSSESPNAYSARYNSSSAEHTMHSTQPSYGGFAANSSPPFTERWNNNTSFAGPTANPSQPSTNTWNSSTPFAGPTANPSQPSNRSWSNESSSWSRGTLANNAYVGSPPQPQNHQSTSNIPNDGYSGKSLEGSCVKEPDPLDMSEEAKAERWFRRAAQIKDISELSQIPDEDFPEIMPMRKGVNRFVISKRKTPLERRLTSMQYRKNLPIVSSEPEKDADN